MAYVMKIKYEDTLRRVTYESKPREEDLSLTKLERKIRDLFKFPAQEEIRVTYTDNDGDVITMADDNDLIDAIFMQSLNPLRLQVTLVKLKSTPNVVLSPPYPAVSAPADKFNFGQVQKPMSLGNREQFRDSPSQLQHLTHPNFLPETLNQLVTATGGIKNFCELAKRLSEAEVFRTPKNVDVGSKNFSSDLLASSPSLAEMVSEAAASHVPSVGKTAEVGLKSCFSDVVASGRTKSLTLHKDFPLLLPSMPTDPTAVRSAEGCPFSHLKSDVNEAVEPKNASRIFHSHVQCDGCGLNPIMGARFKSTKKHDYDLCQSCFNEIGNATDYTRIDRPLYRPRHLHSLSSARMRCPAFNPNLHSGRPMSMCSPYASRPEARCHQSPVHQMNGGRLDARFVQDVTILDGTEVVSGTRFTKIWRLRNSGTLPWPPRTTLVNVGGDEMGSVRFVPVELPEQSLAPDQEVEVAVDLIAPEKPGRYVSHWRLAGPAGPKFGHRVWVLIQVVAKESIPTDGKDAVDRDVDMAQEEEISESTPLLSATVSSARDTFVKASHESFATRQEGESRYPKVDIMSSYVDMEEPFSGLNIVDVEIATDVKEEFAAPVTTSTPALPAATPTVPAATPAALPAATPTVPAATPAAPPAVPAVPAAPPAVPAVPAAPPAVPAVPAAPPAVPAATPVTEVELKVEVLPENMVLEEVVSVESSELGGGFSMVELPSNTGSQTNTAPTTPRGESEVPEVSQLNEKFVGEESEEVEVEEMTPESLSGKLEAMGFTDRKLNVELLVKNKLDLRRTLDDLFAAAEWVSVLGELEEMGFYDAEMNRRLMFKNNGSVKRVVKELVQMYKEPAGKGKQVVIE